MMKAARDRYESMFRNNAVALFEEDCLAVKFEVERLKGQGVTDMMGYLNANPQHVREMAGMFFATCSTMQPAVWPWSICGGTTSGSMRNSSA